MTKSNKNVCFSEDLNPHHMPCRSMSRSPPHPTPIKTSVLFSGPLWVLFCFFSLQPLCIFQFSTRSCWYFFNQEKNLSRGEKPDRLEMQMPQCEDTGERGVKADPLKAMAASRKGSLLGKQALVFETFWYIPNQPA